MNKKVTLFVFFIVLVVTLLPMSSSTVLAQDSDSCTTYTVDGLKEIAGALGIDWQVQATRSLIDPNDPGHKEIRLYGYRPETDQVFSWSITVSYHTDSFCLPRNFFSEEQWH